MIPSCSITQLRWETGPVVPQELQQSLSAREMELFNKYDRILTNFTQVKPLTLAPAECPQRSKRGIGPLHVNGCSEKTIGKFFQGPFWAAFHGLIVEHVFAIAELWSSKSQLVPNTFIDATPKEAYITCKCMRITVPPKVS